MNEWVVVLLNLDQCEGFADTRCVMEAYGPFDFDAGRAFLATAPEEFAPHLVRLITP